MNKKEDQREVRVVEDWQIFPEDLTWKEKLRGIPVTISIAWITFKSNVRYAVACLKDRFD